MRPAASSFTNNMNLLIHCCLTESGIGVSARNGSHALPLGLARTHLIFDGGATNSEARFTSPDMFLFDAAEF
nr:hypothetical protein Itr_chr08CG16380 [Ipomoea trifida]